MALQQPPADAGSVQQAPPTPAVQEIILARDIKVADPGPLGLACVALTTFVLSMFNADLVRDGGEPVLFGVALMYGGIAQILAGVWEFRAGNAFGAHGIYVLRRVLAVVLGAGAVLPGDIIKAGAAGKAVGLYLIRRQLIATCQRAEHHHDIALLDITVTPTQTRHDQSPPNAAGSASKTAPPERLPRLTATRLMHDRG